MLALNGLQAKKIFVATGGRAVKLPMDGAEHGIISDNILNHIVFEP